MLSDTMMLGGGRKAAYSIENSLLFRGGQYLSRTPTVSGDAKKFTISTWFRRASLTAAEQVIFSTYRNSNLSGHSIFDIFLPADGRLRVYAWGWFASSSPTDLAFATVRKFSDPNAWYHLVVAVDIANGDPHERVRIYINGLRETDFDSSLLVLPGDQVTLDVNQAGIPHYVGRYWDQVWGSQIDAHGSFWNGSVADCCLIDGTALPPTKFGEFDPFTGSWRPKPVLDVDFGLNGGYLGKAWDAANLGKDYATSGIVPYLSADDKGGSIVLSNNGRTMSCSGASITQQVRAVSPLPVGKWYWEVPIHANTNANLSIGVSNRAEPVSLSVGLSANGWAWQPNYAGDYKFNNGETLREDTAGSADVGNGVGKVAMLAVEVTASGPHKMWVGIDGDWRVAGDPATGANPLFADISGTVFPALGHNSTQSQSTSATLNMGAATFSFTPPAGFSAVPTGGNDWLATGFAASDVLADSPTNVYATLNPIYPLALSSVAAAQKLSSGNLTLTYDGITTANTDSGVPATLTIPARGKWYFEGVISGATSGLSFLGIGIATPGVNFATNGNITAGRYGLMAGNMLYIQNNGAYTSGGSVAADGAVFRGCLDADNGKAFFGIGTSFYSTPTSGNGDPAAGTNPTFTLSLAGLMVFASAWGSSGSITLNFGQRPFAHTPPDGFKALCTANMPATTGLASGTFTGSASADGPVVFTGAVPETLSVNGNAVTWGSHADKLATGFKIRTADIAYNASGVNTWVATYDRKPTVGPKGRAPANAQGNP